MLSCWKCPKRRRHSHESVVDDERTIRCTSQRMLARLGAEVAAVEDGDQVLAAVADAQRRGAPFDAVLMDIVMRRVNGDVACRRLRDAGYAQLPIIASTANVSPTDADEYLQLRFTDVLAKPFSVRQLLTVLARWLPTPPPKGPQQQQQQTAFGC